MDAHPHLETLVTELGQLLEQTFQYSGTISDIAIGLKQEADTYWGRDAKISLMLANLIIGSGEIDDDQNLVALGMMAKGDAYRLLGRFVQSDATLRAAGDLFLQCDNDIGWARTRIGLLMTCLSIEDHSPEELLASADRAQRLFVRHKEYNLLARLANSRDPPTIFIVLNLVRRKLPFKRHWFF